MAKSKKNTPAGNYTTAEIAKTLGTLGASVAELRHKVDELAALGTPIAASTNGDNAAADDVTREALRTEIRGIVREQVERYITESIGGKTFADFVGEKVSRELVDSGNVHAADEMGAAKLHEEIATVVEQRLAGAYMDATSAQIANVESRMRAELQALLEKALAFDGAIGKSIRDAVAARTAAAAPDRSGEQPSRGHRSAVRPVAK